MSHLLVFIVGAWVGIGLMCALPYAKNDEEDEEV